MEKQFNYFACLTGKTKEETLGLGERFLLVDEKENFEKNNNIKFSNVLLFEEDYVQASIFLNQLEQGSTVVIVERHNIREFWHQFIPYFAVREMEIHFMYYPEGRELFRDYKIKAPELLELSFSGKVDFDYSLKEYNHIKSKLGGM